MNTCDYRAGFWYRAERHRSKRGMSNTKLSSGDILLKRVGRFPSQTFGRTSGVIGMECSDCVIVVRPKRTKQSTRILFALRCLAGISGISQLLEKGTGACYVTEKSLNELAVPAALHKKFPKSYQKYKVAVAGRSFDEMHRIEKYIQRRLVNKAKS